jgi:peptidoglycan hydrolase-like protein with peptidoglycan-binding domain
MRRSESNKYHWADLSKLAVLAVFLTACFASRSMAQQPGQKTFSSAEKASNALFMAAKSNDEKAMLDILGPDGKQVVSSGDQAEDTESRATFVQRYQEMHRLVKEPDGMTTLYIGARNWPTPIPLVEKGKVWYFDTEAGKREILYRRVGRNEMSAIRVCEELVAAENEYRQTRQQGMYAQKIKSDEGDRNGLYWKARDDKVQSPVGPLVASAAVEGNGNPMPYRGYYYRILTSQGKDAPGGAKSYIVNGKMTTGFAFVAYPAEYRSSGVMTFIVSLDGVVYQKDLGKNTDGLAKAMNEYNRDSGWKKAKEQPEEMAAEQKTK